MQDTYTPQRPILFGPVQFGPWKPVVYEAVCLETAAACFLSFVQNEQSFSYGGRRETDVEAHAAADVLAALFNCGRDGGAPQLNEKSVSARALASGYRLGRRLPDFNPMFN